jgi:hypothetical protein
MFDGTALARRTNAALAARLAQNAAVLRCNRPGPTNPPRQWITRIGNACCSTSCSLHIGSSVNIAMQPNQRFIFASAGRRKRGCFTSRDGAPCLLMQFAAPHQAQRNLGRLQRSAFGR